MAPENGWLEDEISSWDDIKIQVQYTLVLGSIVFHSGLFIRRIAKKNSLF